MLANITFNITIIAPIEICFYCKFDNLHLSFTKIGFQESLLLCLNPTKIPRNLKWISPNEQARNCYLACTNSSFKLIPISLRLHIFTHKPDASSNHVCKTLILQRLYQEPSFIRTVSLGSYSNHENTLLKSNIGCKF